MSKLFYPSELRQHKWIGIFVIYLHYLLGVAFVFSAISKIEGHRFTTADGANSPIDSGSHYFETMYRSGLYWIALGWAQLLAGLVLMSQKLATLGAVMILPISVNIFLITLTYHFPGTVYITFLILIANLFLLYWDLPGLYNAFKPDSMRP
ncbi:MAG: DoxX family protein, partial [Sphingobacteriaceae bacterium]